MFDWLFKRTKPEKDEFERIKDEIVNLYDKIDSVKSSCLEDDKKIIEPLRKRIGELKAVQSARCHKQREKIIDQLNTFPLHKPCMFEDICDTLGIDWWTLHHVMYKIDDSVLCRPRPIEYILALDNWQEVKYDRRTYLERMG